MYLPIWVITIFLELNVIQIQSKQFGHKLGTVLFQNQQSTAKYFMNYYKLDRPKSMMF